MTKTIIFYDGGCSDCQKVAGLLSAQGVDYIRHNIKGHPDLMAEVKRSGMKTLPSVIVDGKVIEGFNEQEILAALK